MVFQFRSSFVVSQTIGERTDRQLSTVLPKLAACHPERSEAESKDPAELPNVMRRDSSRSQPAFSHKRFALPRCQETSLIVKPLQRFLDAFKPLKRLRHHGLLVA